MALVEITTPTFWYNVDENHCRFSISKKNDEGWMETGVPPGYYSSNEYLISQLNDRGKDIVSEMDKWLHYNKYERKVLSTVPEGIRIKLPVGLARILGFQNETALSHATDEYPERGVDLNHGVHALFIYTDLISHQIVGNAEVPLLRTVRMKSFTGGDRPEMDTVVFTQPHFVPVSKHYIESIEIDIRDDTGERIPYSTGKVICKLHFRQRKPSFL